MLSPEMKLAAARAKAREHLAAVTDAEDRAITQAAVTDADARPPDEARLARMRHASAADAADLGRRAGERGRPPLAAPKRLVSLRLDPEVIDSFRMTGRGWQSRINAVLRAHLPSVPD